MRRPAPKSLSDIRHPGPRCADRLPFKLCRADGVAVSIAKNDIFLKALADWFDATGYESAVFNLSGMSLSPFQYVMPDRAIDDRHAAWYSDTKSSKGSVLTEAVAIAGKKDGAWFAHIHAYWHENDTVHLGHLLPDTLVAGKHFKISGYGIKGACFVAEPDPETEFTLFRVRETANNSEAFSPNALITTLAPFEDLTESIETLSHCLNTQSIKVFGLGSLAGAEFTNSLPMTGLVSEILLQQDRSSRIDENTTISIRSVDLDGHIHQGELQSGKAPTLVTCELLLVESPG